MSASPTRSCCTPGRASTMQSAMGGGIAEGAGYIDARFSEVPGGRYRVGYEGPLAHPEDGEGPERDIELSSFEIAETTVTNAQFAAFVAATGYVTDAQRHGDSFVFDMLLDEAVAARSPPVDDLPWWRRVEGACWLAPEGEGSSISERDDHPVVHVSFRDAVAFARWSGTRLPTELEWEVAARGGLRGALYPWGDELTPGGRWQCNIWQGTFPYENSLDDGYLGTAPVRSYPANGYGLHEICGNVWEWVAGSWSGRDHACVRRGGSYLCHDSWCNRYRVTGRTRGLPADSAVNVGFRVALKKWVPPSNSQPSSPAR